MTKLKIFITENHEEDRIPKIDTITKNPNTTYLKPKNFYCLAQLH